MYLFQSLVIQQSWVKIKILTSEINVGEMCLHFQMILFFTKQTQRSFCKQLNFWIKGLLKNQQSSRAISNTSCTSLVADLLGFIWFPQLFLYLSLSFVNFSLFIFCIFENKHEWSQCFIQGPDPIKFWFIQIYEFSNSPLSGFVGWRSSEMIMWRAPSEVLQQERR